MKTNLYSLLCAVALSFAACGSNKGDYDASGVFEATEVTLSAMGAGQIMQLDLEEGQVLEANRAYGYIDTLQLHLKKRQLLAGMTAVESRHYDVARQIASIRQQIATQEKEKIRYERLVGSNAANQKQLDDVLAQLALLEKQLAAQTETLENNNRSLSGESLGLEAQIAQTDDQILKCIISAPIDGVVLAKYAERGEFAMQGRALCKVADIANMELRVYITADQLTQVKLGQPVQLFADWGRKERRAYRGHVSWISDKAEFTPKTIQTRDERANLVYAVKVAVSNDGYLKKGMYGEVKFQQ